MQEAIFACNHRKKVVVVLTESGGPEHRLAGRWESLELQAKTHTIILQHM